MAASTAGKGSNAKNGSNGNAASGSNRAGTPRHSGQPAVPAEGPTSGATQPAPAHSEAQHLPPRADSPADPGAAGEPAGAGGRRSGQMAASRTAQFLVAAATVSTAEELRTALDRQNDIQVIAVFDSAPDAAGPPPACPPIAVIETSEQRAAELAGSRGWLVEPDLPLALVGSTSLGALAVADPSLLPTGQPDRLTIVVRDTEQRPIPAAAVYLHGPWPGYAITDTDGRAALTVPAGCLQSTTTLIVAPTTGHWSTVIGAPQLSSTNDNLITVAPLSATFDDFPNRPIVSWGAQALQVSQLPPTYRGHGVKIALIDSGIDAAHPELTGRITHGAKFGAKLINDPASWSVDPLGSGTACAGIIAAADNDRAVTGLAVDGQLHAVKVTPGGALSNLLQAIDYCITERIDIAQINVTIPMGSALLAAKLADARNAGVAVIAPAGDTFGPVTSPAALPAVLAVGAIGRLGTHPADSIHAAHLAAPTFSPTGRSAWQQRQTDYPADGELPATFSPTGPGIDLVAPGVAILTTTLGGYTVRDGTALAAAHITALAALVLAHHDDFQHAHQQRGPDRIDHLHRLLIASCRPLGDPARTGAGIPDARRALGITTPQYDWETAVLHQLHTDLTRAGLLPQRT